MPAGTSLVRRRTERYDAVSGVFYAPMEYEFPFIANDLPERMPDPQWIDDNFLSFVRGELGSSITRRPEPAHFALTPHRESTVGLDFLKLFLEKCESRYYTYGGPVDRIRSERGDDMAWAIYDLLCDPTIGHRKNSVNNPLDTFRAKIGEQVDRRERLVYLLPSFPFKDQNRFRTYSGASTVDLGELALLVRLHCLALAVYQVHPFGADIVILSDGQLYADIFGVNPNLASRYKEQLRQFRNLLNLQGTVSLLDLAELISRFDSPEAGLSRVSSCTAAIRDTISSYDQRQDQVGGAFRVLLRGMKWNLNTRDSLSQLSDRDAWVVVTEMDREKVPTELRKDWEEIDERGQRAAIEYASVNLMLRYLDLLSRVFPGALRGTVHPKPGQFAIPLSGGLYPWNGVATVTRGQPSGPDVRTVALYELAGHKVELVRLDTSGELLYFELVR